VNFDNLTMRSPTPLTPERIEAYVGTDCRIVRELREPYVYGPYVIVEAEATDDPHVAAIRVEPKRVWHF
jgi:hypothetical protein